MDGRVRPDAASETEVVSRTYKLKEGEMVFVTNDATIPAS